MDKDFSALIENAKSDEELAALKVELEAEIVRLKGLIDLLNGDNIG